MKAEVIKKNAPVQIEGNFREKVINLSSHFTWLPGGDRIRRRASVNAPYADSVLGTIPA
jgi:hypothetical protein